MPYADDTVDALHLPQKPEGPHYIRFQGSEGGVLQLSLEGKAVPADGNVYTVAVKAGAPQANLQLLLGGPKLRFRVLQPPGAAVRDLEKKTRGSLP